MGPTARAVVRLALVLLLLAAASAVWELFARQAPGSVLYIDTLPGPIAHLRVSATTLGVVLLVVVWLLPWAYGPREPRLMLVLCCLGAALTVGTCFYGALRGMYLVQVVDHRLHMNLLFALKYGGQLLLGVCLIDLAWRILFRRPAR